jgi:hypothetical protein
MTQMTTKKRVNLIAYGGEIINRIVVSVEGDVYFVCKSEEFAQAKLEGREPVCIGFRKQYILKGKDK